MTTSLRRFVHSWHWVWVVGAGLVAWASLVLGDPRPVLVAVWWLGYVMMGVIMLAGVLGAPVMMVIGIRQNLAARKKDKSS